MIYEFGAKIKRLEGSHWLIHRKAFAMDNPFGPAGIYANQLLAAKEGRGDYLRN